MTAPTQAVQIIEQGIEFNLDSFPEDRFNRLIPTQTIRMPSDLVVPVVQVVQLNIEADTYTSHDVPSGHRALNRVGLRKLATAAAVSILNEHKSDDGKDPDVCEVTCTAEMVLPTGQRIQVPGIKRVDLNAQSWASAAQRKKYASFFQEQVASRAENRGIRALLSLLASYPVKELAKPFAVVTFAPNMDHPEVRARLLDAMAPSVQALYGPERAAQLEAGGPVTVVAQAPDDDEVGQIEASTGGHATVDGATGEVEAPEADWFGTVSDADLGARLLRVAEANASATGPATDAQRKALQEVLRGVNASEVGIVLAQLFDIGHLSAIEQRHAQAILEAGEAMGHEQLRAEWKALAVELATTEAA